MGFLEVMERYFQMVVQIGVLVLECIGVIVLFAAAVKSIIALIRKDSRIRLVLAEGIALALEFKLGGEVLRTAIVRDASELITLGAIILLRGVLTFLIHWEIKVEESKMDPLKTVPDPGTSAALQSGEKCDREDKQ